EGPVILELQSADGVGDPFDGVPLAVGEVVGGVDIPGIPGAVVGNALDAVQHRVAEVDVGGAHVDSGTQGHFSLFDFASAHFFQQRQAFRRWPVPVGAVFARLGQGAAIQASVL